MSAFGQDPTQADMQAYLDTPSLLGQFSVPQQQPGQPPPPESFIASMNPPPAPAASETSTDAAGQDFSFGELGLDANTQLLEAILAELRTLNQNIRELT